MQSVSSRIWTRVAVLISYDDNHYSTGTSKCIINNGTFAEGYPTRHQLYGHLPPITKTIQVRRTRHAGHCWRSRDELIRDVLLWIPTHGRAKAGRPARTYIQQLCEDTGCCPEDLPRAMNDREEWRKRVRDIRAASTIWWWWWWRLPQQPANVLYMEQNWLWVSSDAGTLGNVKCYFIAIAPWSILARSGSTWWGLFYASNSTVDTYKKRIKSNF